MQQHNRTPSLQIPLRPASAGGAPERLPWLVPLDASPVITTSSHLLKPCRSLGSMKEKVSQSEESLDLAEEDFSDPDESSFDQEETLLELELDEREAPTLPQSIVCPMPRLMRAPPATSSRYCLQDFFLINSDVDLSSSMKARHEFFQIMNPAAALSKSPAGSAIRNRHVKSAIKPKPLARRASSASSNPKKGLGLVF